MNFKSHLTVGMFVGSIAALDLSNLYWCVAIGGIGSMLPDLDHGSSIISRYTWPVSLVVSKTFSHRGFTHSFLFTAFVGLTVAWMDVESYTLRALLYGLLSHIFMDMLTVRGCSLLYPYRKKFKLLWFKSGGDYERLITRCVCLVITAYWLLVLFELGGSNCFA